MALTESLVSRRDSTTLPARRGHGKWAIGATWGGGERGSQGGDLGRGGGTARDSQVLAIEGFVIHHLGSSRHERRVAVLAERLFKLTRSWHGLGNKYLKHLWIAALLHDIGRAVDDDRHPVLGAKLIQRTRSVSLRPRERRIAAFVARYHRGAVPTRLDTDYLRKRDEQIAMILLGLIRAADALDSRSHGAARVRIERTGKGDRRLHLHVTPLHTSTCTHKAVSRRKKYRLLESTLDCSIKLKVLGTTSHP